MTVERVLAQLQALPFDRLMTATGLGLVLVLAFALLMRRRRQARRRNIGLARIEQALEDLPDPMAKTTPSIADAPADPLEDDGIETLQKTYYTERVNDPTPRTEPEAEVLAPEPIAPDAVTPSHADETPPRHERPTSDPVPAVPALPPFPAWSFLKTLPFVMRRGLTTKHADILGIGVEAVFFPPEIVNAQTDTVLRLVPFLPEESGELICREIERRTFTAGPLFAQPDAVIAIDGGLLSVEYKSRGGRLDDPDRLDACLRPKDLLQTVIEAMVLSASEGRPVAPILRTHNAVYFLRPSRTIMGLLTERLGAGLAFISPYAQRSGISASDYAGLCLVPAQMLTGRTLTDGAGERAHAEMLR